MKNEKFPNTQVSHMGVQKFKLWCRVELCAENGEELIEYFYIQVFFCVEKDFLITEMAVSS
jgi:hypothetical protein